MTLSHLYTLTLYGLLILLLNACDENTNQKENNNTVDAIFNTKNSDTESTKRLEKNVTTNAVRATNHNQEQSNSLQQKAGNLQSDIEKTRQHNEDLKKRINELIKKNQQHKDILEKQ